MTIRTQGADGPPSDQPVAGSHFEQLIASAKARGPIRTAIVHPCDDLSLAGALEARDAGLIVPVLVGPAAKVVATAARIRRDLGAIEIVDVAHSHAAAARAVALAHAGEVDALMKGSLHSDEFMSPIVAAEGGLRIGRRMSHVFVLDLPQRTTMLLLTDAAVNIAPDLDTKRDIVQNAIDLFRLLRNQSPRVAILSAVETVSPKIPSTVDAAALSKMADRRQIVGGIVDGPLAFDDAMSPTAARAKGIDSPVAGVADILVVPDLEAGNILAKQFVYVGAAEPAGVVVGGKLPIVLTSRSDGSLARLASCALAVLIAHANATRASA